MVQGRAITTNEARDVSRAHTAIDLGAHGATSAALVDATPELEKLGVRAARTCHAAGAVVTAGAVMPAHGARALAGGASAVLPVLARERSAALSTVCNVTMGKGSTQRRVPRRRRDLGRRDSEQNCQCTGDPQTRVAIHNATPMCWGGLRWGRG